MGRKTGRRAALKALGATPLGLAGGVALAERALAEGLRGQAPIAAVRARVSTGPVEPGAGTWRPVLLDSGSQLRLPAPPDSAAELEQVRAMAGQRDAAVLDRITYWDAGSSPYRWNEIAIEHTNVRNNFGNNTGGRALALVNVAIYDAVNGIAGAGGAAAASVLAGFFCADEVPFSLASDSGGGEARSYPSFSAAAEEAGRSRVVGGLHFEFSNQAGLAAGRAVASEVLGSALLVRHGPTHDGTCPL